MQKLLKAPSFGIQLEESNDVNGESQFMVLCKFPDIEAKKLVKRYLFCQPVEEKAIAETIFKKLNKFFKRGYNRVAKFPLSSLQLLTTRFATSSKICRFYFLLIKAIIEIPVEKRFSIKQLFFKLILSYKCIAHKLTDDVG